MNNTRIPIGSTLLVINMNNTPITAYDKIFLLVFIVFFILWEYKRPARNNRFTITSVDMIAVTNLFVFSLLCKFVFQPFDSLVAKAPLGSFPFEYKIVFAVIFMDFLLYWLHRAMHTKLLWKTHWFHHSVTEMNWLKGSYTSATHISMYVAPQLIIGYYILGFTTLEMMGCIIAGYFIQLWQHANVSVNIGFLSYIFVTPQAHRLHHSLSSVRNKNFGALFILWDRMFGTYAHPSNEKYALGVPKKYGLLRGLIGI